MDVAVVRGVKVQDDFEVGKNGEVVVVKFYNVVQVACKQKFVVLAVSLDLKVELMGMV